LVQHEKASKLESEQKIEDAQHLIDYLLVEREDTRRRGQDTSFIQSQIDKMAVAVDQWKEFISSTRQYTWTPGTYSRLANILATPVMGSGGIWRANNDAQKLFDFLGFPPMIMPGEDPTSIQKKKDDHQERIRNRPASI